MEQRIVSNFGAKIYELPDVRHIPEGTVKEAMGSYGLGISYASLLKDLPSDMLLTQEDWRIILDKRYHTNQKLHILRMRYKRREQEGIKYKTGDTIKFKKPKSYLPIDDDEED